MSEEFRPEEVYITPKLSDWEIGYIAGLIDGEGWIYYGVQKKGRWLSPCYQIGIANTDNKVLHWVMEKVGFGKIRNLGKQRNAVITGKKDMFNWVVHRRNDLEKLIKLIDGKLIIKKDRLEELKKFLAKHPPYTIRRRVWTEERITLLRRLAGQGFQAKQIAQQIFGSTEKNIIYRVNSARYRFAAYIKRKPLRCVKCGFVWIPKRKELPKLCPKCKSEGWNAVGKRKIT
jgi:predicted Zn-ribbon and HTH transcriptional regulator